MPKARLKRRSIEQHEYLQVKMWPCVNPEGAQEQFYAWLKGLSEQLGRKDLLLIFAIPNLGQFVLPALHEQLTLEGVKKESMDMFLPIAACGKHGLFYSFKGAVKKESAKVPRRTLAKALIGQGFGVIFTRDWKYAALKTSHYLAGTYEQDPIPEGRLS